MKKIILTAIVIGLSACGGGGGGGSSSSDQVVTSPVSAITAINASDALTKFLGTDQSISNLSSNDGYLGKATLIVRTEESSPFITNGLVQESTFTKVIQLQRSNSSGKLQYQYLWKLHFDAQKYPIGMAVGNAFSDYKECSSVTSKNDLPISTNSSGTYFSGVQTLNYAETFRAGTYGHYCDPTGSNISNVEWSVAAGTPNPYFCLTMPDSFYASKTRMCIPVDKNGVLNNSIWISLLNSDGTTSVDYKDTSSNKPIEQFSTIIDPNNYWYGAAWRPLDGYIYQSYTNTKFSSQQACRNQTVIDWKKTWNADNISWTCINVTSK